MLDIDAEDIREREALLFYDVIRVSLADTDFISEFNRLSVTKLGVDNRSPIDRMVDEATGYQRVLDGDSQVAMAQFVEFVYKHVWLPYIVLED